MAITKAELDKLDAQYNKITEENRKAYDALYTAKAGSGFGNSGTIGVRYEDAVRRKDTKLIESLKPTYDKLAAEYNRTQTEKNRLKAQLDAAQKEYKAGQSKESNVKSAQSVYDKAMTELRLAEAKSMTYQGEQKYIEAYKKAATATEDLKKLGVNAPVPILAPGIDPAKVATGTGGTGTGGTGTDGKKAQEATYTDIINTLADPKNSAQLIQVQKDLKKNFGYKGNADGKWSLDFQNAIQSAYQQRATLPDALKGADFRTFLAKPGISGTAGSGTGGTGGTGLTYETPRSTIYSETDIKDAIDTVWTKLLRRDPNPGEIKSIGDQLRAAQQDPKNATRIKINPKTGVAESTGGLNVDQFLEEIVKAMPEYQQKKTGAVNQSLEDVLATARNNGMNVTGAQQKTWSDRIAAGEDPKTIASEIRAASSLGYPDSIKKLMASGTDLGTVLSPYKQYMASILEVNPNSIDINDPALRMAIGKDGEMNLYDYQRALRQDNRWQYTSNARDAVSNAAQQILKDFGFKG